MFRSNDGIHAKIQLNICRQNQECVLLPQIYKTLGNQQFSPQNYVKLETETDIKNMEKLIDHLEDNDDVQNVYHNWEQ